MAGNPILGADLGVTVAGQGIHETSTTAKYRLGERIQIGDRVFRYARAGAAITDAIRGLQNQNKPYEGDRPETAYPIGATEIVVPETSTGNGMVYGVKNMYQGGYIWFQTSYNAFHKIKSNTAADSDNNVTLTLETPLVYALDAEAGGQVAAWVTIWPSIYYDVRHKTSAMCTVVGTALVAIAAESYFWLQTWGPKFFRAGATAPGRTADYRTVVFASDGAILDASAGAVGSQRVGYILGQTTSSDGDQFVMMQLTP